MNNKLIFNLDLNDQSMVLKVLKWQIPRNNEMALHIKFCKSIC